MKVLIKRVRDVEVPIYQHKGDSGMDLVSADKDTIWLARGERALIPTGISVAVPEGYEIQIRSRSGLALKKGLMVLNSPGTIDSGYRGEIGVIILNTSSQIVTIDPGMRIAQAVLQKVEIIEFEEVDNLEDTSRSEGGFGSTGK